MDRLEAFEKMLADVKNSYEQEKIKMDELKSQGREKSATYRQYMGNRLTYIKLLDMYKEYGLI